MLSPTEEEELAKQVTKMGENGPVIFDRHFYTLVRKYNTLPQNFMLYRPPRTLTDTISTTLNGSTLSGSPCLDWWYYSQLTYRNNPLTLTYISGVNVLLPEETCKMGFEEESTSRGLIKKQDKVFDKISFSRAGLTKVLMLVSFKETKNVRFRKLVLDPFWFWFSFGSLFPRLVSDFSLFNLVSFVDPTGKNIPFQPYTLSLFIDYL